jgi:hypothetical protein
MLRYSYIVCLVKFFKNIYFKGSTLSAISVVARSKDSERPGDAIADNRPTKLQKHIVQYLTD